jgi:hypothetical protein
VGCYTQRREATSLGHACSIPHAIQRATGRPVTGRVPLPPELATQKTSPGTLAFSSTFSSLPPSLFRPALPTYRRRSGLTVRAIPRKYPPLLPAPALSKSTSESSNNPDAPDEPSKCKRIGVQVACNNCRVKKTRVSLRHRRPNLACAR